jgi:probable addiction module antidote protein
MSQPVSRPWEETLYPQLRDDDELAAGYLSDALNEDDPGVFLLALRQVSEARGVGMSELARLTGLDRAGLYRSLSESGNPAWNSLSSILKTLGFQIFVGRRAS